MATVNPESNQVLQALLAKLSPKPRELVLRRFGHMTRELAYLYERRDENLAFIQTKKWTEARLTTLFAFNCVYQEVLGPLQASARHSKVGLGEDIPILHGSVRFDVGRSVRVNRALADFHVILKKLGFEIRWMTLNTCGDVVFRVAAFERNGRQPADEDNEL